MNHPIRVLIWPLNRLFSLELSVFKPNALRDAWGRRRSLNSGTGVIGLCTALLLTVFTVEKGHAIEPAVSVFGSVGWAQSDRADRYLTSIDRQGSFHPDSRLGLQLDLRFNPYWAATMQVTADPDQDHDSGFNPKLKWAFLSYRPDNDWLFRVGKLRVGSLLYMQTMDQGVTYPWARLPAEVYSVSPSYDFTGMSVSWNWTNGDALDFSVEGILGRSKNHWRQYLFGQNTARYLPLDFNVKGLLFALNEGDALYRFGWYHIRAQAPNHAPFASEFFVVPNHFPAGLHELGGMGGDLLIPTRGTMVKGHAFSLGATIPFGAYTVTGEYARRVITNIKTGPGSHSGFLSLSRKLGRWTPYIMHARMISSAKERHERRLAWGATPPSTGGLMPDVDLAIASQYADAAGAIYGFDQYSWMLGTSYALSPTQRLKFELMRTRVGENSSLVDQGGARTTRHVLSVSYHFAF